METDEPQVCNKQHNYPSKFESELTD